MDEIQAALERDGWKPIRAGRFADLAGPLWSVRRDGEWIYGVISTENHLNPGGIVHGGLLQLLIDHALSTIAWEAAARTPCVTVQLDTHFLAPVRDGVLIEARGRVVRRTSSLLFMQGSLCVGENEVLTAQAVMKVVRPQGG